MPSFETTGPIKATIDVLMGSVRIKAVQRDAVVVDVRPSDESNAEDVRAAEGTRVEFAGGHLLLKAPKLRSWLPHRDGGSTDVTIELPAGSQVRGAGQLADFHAEGELGECQYHDRARPHRARARRRAEPQERQRRHRRRARRGPCRGQDRHR